MVKPLQEFKVVVRKHSAIVLTMTEKYGASESKTHYVKIAGRFYFAGNSKDTSMQDLGAASKVDGFWYDGVAEILRRNKSCGNGYELKDLLPRFRRYKFTLMLRHWETRRHVYVRIGR